MELYRCVRKKNAYVFRAPNLSIVVHVKRACCLKEVIVPPGLYARGAFPIDLKQFFE